VPLVTCPECDHEAIAPRELIGVKWACPSCGTRFIVSDGDRSAPQRRWGNRFGPWVVAAGLGVAGLFVFGLLAVAVSRARPADPKPSDLGIVLEGVAVILVGVGVYFAPTVVARARGHNNLAPIVVVNLFLGWTLVGWVIALAWAVADFKHHRRNDQ